MIAPAVTVWPANTLTPSRWAAESRPFLDDPRPFLCAIARLLLRAPRGRAPPRRLRLLRRRRLGRGRARLPCRRLLRRRLGPRLAVGRLGCALAGRGALRLRFTDRVDLDPAQLRPVSARLLEPTLGLEREDADLLAAQVLDDLGRDGPLELLRVRNDVVAARHQDRRRERLARSMRLPVDQELLPLLDAVLLPADLDDRVHEPRNGISRPEACPASVRPSARRPAPPRKGHRRSARGRRPPPRGGGGPPPAPAPRPGRPGGGGRRGGLGPLRRRRLRLGLLARPPPSRLRLRLLRLLVGLGRGRLLGLGCRLAGPAPLRTPV